MANFIIRLAEKIAEYSFTKWFKFIFLVFVTIFISLIISIPNFKKESILNDYLIINHEKISEYNTILVMADEVSDTMYIPTVEYQGIAVMFDEVIHDDYIEMYLGGPSEYRLSFLRDNIKVHEMRVDTYENGRLVEKIDENIIKDGYDCILIAGEKGKELSINYLNPLEKYEDNVVFEKLEVQYMLASCRNDSSLYPYKITGIQAYNNGFDDDVFTIELANIHDRDINLISIVDEEDKEICSFSEDNNILEYSYEIEYVTFAFKNVNRLEVDNKKLYINYTIEGDTVSKKVQIHDFPRFNMELFNNTEIRNKSNIDEFDFIEYENGNIIFDCDFIVIDKPMYIPSQLKLLVKPGQTIDLINCAYIKSNSPVIFDGNQDNPIHVISSDDTGMGLFVSQAKAKSYMRHTHFEQLDTPVSGAWQLTGAVTFYESDLEVYNCSFKSNKCEDALNIVRSNFYIDECIFEDTFGDAFDADFCSGKLMNSRFENTGNDAFDVSTSNIELTNTYFSNIGDKAISGGEKSELNIQDCIIIDSIIGVASKDTSLLKISNLNINNSEIGLTLYQKKPEFSGAYMKVNGLSLTGDIGIDYLIQNGSELWIDGRYIKPRSRSKETIFFERMINGQSIVEIEDND